MPMVVFTSIFTGDKGRGKDGGGDMAAAAVRRRGRNGPRKRCDEKGLREADAEGRPKINVQRWAEVVMDTAAQTTIRDGQSAACHTAQINACPLADGGLAFISTRCPIFRASTSRGAARERSVTSGASNLLNSSR